MVTKNVCPQPLLQRLFALLRETTDIRLRRALGIGMNAPEIVKRAKLYRND